MKAKIVIWVFLLFILSSLLVYTKSTKNNLRLLASSLGRGPQSEGGGAQLLPTCASRGGKGCYWMDQSYLHILDEPLWGVQQIDFINKHYAVKCNCFLVKEIFAIYNKLR